MNEPRIPFCCPVLHQCRAVDEASLPGLPSHCHPLAPAGVGSGVWRR